MDQNRRLSRNIEFSLWTHWTLPIGFANALEKWHEGHKMGVHRAYIELNWFWDRSRKGHVNTLLPFIKVELHIQLLHQHSPKSVPKSRSTNTAALTATPLDWRRQRQAGAGPVSSDERLTVTRCNYCTILVHNPATANHSAPILLHPKGVIKVLFKKAKSWWNHCGRQTDRQEGPRSGINLNFCLRY